GRAKPLWPASYGGKRRRVGRRLVWDRLLCDHAGSQPPRTCQRPIQGGARRIVEECAGVVASSHEKRGITGSARRDHRLSLRTVRAIGETVGYEDIQSLELPADRDSDEPRYDDPGSSCRCVGERRTGMERLYERPLRLLRPLSRNLASWKSTVGRSRRDALSSDRQQSRRIIRPHEFLGGDEPG